MENKIEHNKNYDFIDLVKIFQRADFSKWDWADIFVLKNKFRWSIENQDQEHYFKHFILKKLNQLLEQQK